MNSAKARGANTELAKYNAAQASTMAQTTAAPRTGPLFALALSVDAMRCAPARSLSYFACEAPGRVRWASRARERLGIVTENWRLALRASLAPLHVTRLDMIFRQLFDSTSSTYSYLLPSRTGGAAVIIDPVLERVDRYIQLLKELDLRLVKAIDTHLHADHITGLDAL